MKFVGFEQSAIHVCASAYLAREKRPVDAASLLVVVYVCVEDLGMQIPERFSD